MATQKTVRKKKKTIKRDLVNPNDLRKKIPDPPKKKESQALTQFSEVHKEKFIEALKSNGGNISNAVAATGFSRTAVYSHMEKDRKFKQRVNDIFFYCDDNVDTSMYKTALEGNVGAMGLYKRTKATSLRMIEQSIVDLMKAQNWDKTDTNSIDKEEVKSTALKRLDLLFRFALAKGDVNQCMLIQDKMMALLGVGIGMEQEEDALTPAKLLEILSQEQKVEHTHKKVEKMKEVYLTHSKGDDVPDITAAV